MSVLILTALATMRVTRLVTTDYLTERPRRWVQRHAPTSIAYLVGCPWCSSVWVAAVLAALVLHTTSWITVGVLMTLAASEVTGLLARFDPPDDHGLPEGDVDGE